MRILLIEPYFGGSHKAWAEGYARHSQHQVDLLTLPARFWKWRLQGGAATLAEAAMQTHPLPDLLLATDMLNLPAFLGLTRHHLANVPAVLYCHETQLTYPIRPGEKRDLTYGMINWLSMLAAERILFNSAYHLEDWFDALPRLLKHFPDLPHLHRIPEVRSKSQVLPVGCDLARFDAPGRLDGDEGPPLILWNQRWEYDKDPQTFFRALDVLLEEGASFRLALAGSNVRQMPEEFAAARERLTGRIVHYGRAGDKGYVRLLWQSNIVVSTAIHEFFGVAVAEAIYCGAFPILPRRLAYPELVPSPYHERCLYEDFEGLLGRLRWALDHVDWARQIARELRAAVARFDWERLGPEYDQLLAEIAPDCAPS